MDNLEKLEEELISLKTIEADIIDRMRIVNINTDERVHLLCRLEVIRYYITPISLKLEKLIYENMKNSKK